ncbi:Senescence domain-containing protein [Ceratobasidium sp. AG-Ba]|nr:Senescence domain-containing protein [Ceratobasidium sp. AG-Ba]QRW11540.1 Senescence domain-containing protein [Ceratobasidium sp. AG-Ba]
MSAPELVSIDNCTAVQVLPSQDVPLASGTLQLLSAPEQEPTEGVPAPHSSDGTTPILTLKVGNAAFPIAKSTTFYTHVDSPRIYVFSPVLDDAAIGAGTYVKITLPEEISVEGSEAERARNTFEEVLVQHKLLEDGPGAVADEISAGARETGASIAAGIHRMATQHTSGPPNPPTTFSPTTHVAADSAVSGTSTVQSYASAASQTMASFGTSLGASASAAASKASETVARAGVAVGERLVHLLGVEDQVEQVSAQARGTSDALAASGAEEEAKYGDGTAETAKELGQAAMEVGAGVRDGAATAVGATRDAATSVLQHDAGPEAVELANKGGQATANLGQATADVTLATSAVATAGYISAGIKEGPEAAGASTGPQEEFK